MITAKSIIIALAVVGVFFVFWLRERRTFRRVLKQQQMLDEEIPKLAKLASRRLSLRHSKPPPELSALQKR